MSGGYYDPVSGVDERVERVREAIDDYGYDDMPLGPYIDREKAHAALSSLAASVASAEQRADEAEKALRFAGGHLEFEGNVQGALDVIEAALAAEEQG